MNYQIEKPMTLFQKLEILADAAKYDVACTSSGVDRRNDGQGKKSLMPVSRKFCGRFFSISRSLFGKNSGFSKSSIM